MEEFNSILNGLGKALKKSDESFYAALMAVKEPNSKRAFVELIVPAYFCFVEKPEENSTTEEKKDWISRVYGGWHVTKK